MSDLKPRGVAIVFDGVERHLLFTLNAIEALQESQEKSLEEIMTDLTQEGVAPKTMAVILTTLLNDEAEREKDGGGRELPILTEKEVGWLISLDNYLEITVAVLKAYGLSMPEAEDERPNRESGHRKSSTLPAFFTSGGRSLATRKNKSSE